MLVNRTRRVLVKQLVNRLRVVRLPLLLAGASLVQRWLAFGFGAPRPRCRRDRLPLHLAGRVLLCDGGASFVVLGRRGMLCFLQIVASHLVLRSRRCRVRK